MMLTPFLYKTYEVDMSLSSTLFGFETEAHMAVHRDEGGAQSFHGGCGQADGEGEQNLAGHTAHKPFLLVLQPNSERMWTGLMQLSRLRRLWRC